MATLHARQTVIARSLFTLSAGARLGLVLIVLAPIWLAVLAVIS